MSEITRVLLHFPSETHKRLVKLKNSLDLTWEEFIVFLSKFHNEEQSKQSKK